MRYWQPKLRVVRPGTWLQFDGSRRIAVIRTFNAGYPPRPLLRADTWAEDDVARDFIGYFPADELRLCAEMVWSLYQGAISTPPKDTTMTAKQPTVLPVLSRSIRSSESAGLILTRGPWS
jgi:hypothetical protein